MSDCIYITSPSLHFLRRHATVRRLKSGLSCHVWEGPTIRQATMKQGIIVFNCLKGREMISDGVCG